MTEDKQETISVSQLVLFFLFVNKATAFHELGMVIIVLAAVSATNPEEKNGPVQLIDLETP